MSKVTTKDNNVNVFISYSRKDYEWVKRIRTSLKPLVNSKEIIVLSDMDILPGQNWNEQIRNFLEWADVAIVLISPSYLASDFIRNVELPSICKAIKENHTQVIPIMIQSVEFEEEILNYKFLNPSQPLVSLSQKQQDTYLRKLLRLLEEITNQIKTKKRPLNKNLTLVGKNIENHSIFYGSEENIFIQAERELESNRE
ncbi:MAG: toll/interleukin-1 receptor domain-containing protein [Cyanobacteria bacterium P01_F01_bin.143]